MYSVNIPVSPPLASGFTAPPPVGAQVFAPAINVATPTNLLDVVFAMKELKAVETLEACNIATPAEVAQSAVRLAAVKGEIATQVYGGAQPPWAVRMEAKLDNLRIRHHNDLARQVPGMGFLPLIKEVAGVHGLVGLVPGGGPAPPPVVAAPAVGTQPPAGLFPLNPEAIAAVTHANILSLMQFYNDDFGVIAGDPVATRIEKFRRWLSV